MLGAQPGGGELNPLTFKCQSRIGLADVGNTMHRMQMDQSICNVREWSKAVIGLVSGTDAEFALNLDEGSIVDVMVDLNRLGYIALPSSKNPCLYLLQPSHNVK